MLCSLMLQSTPMFFDIIDDDIVRVCFGSSYVFPILTAGSALTIKRGSNIPMLFFTVDLSRTNDFVRCGSCACISACCPHTLGTNVVLAMSVSPFSRCKCHLPWPFLPVRSCTCVGNESTRTSNGHPKHEGNSKTRYSKHTHTSLLHSYIYIDTPHMHIH